ncbi:MAG: multicopper oxidase family protein [Pseudomonadota bacterium]
MNRRQFMQGLGTCGTLMALSGCGGSGGDSSTNSPSPGSGVTPPDPTPAPSTIFDLEIQKAQFLLRDQITTDLISLSSDQPPPVLHLNQDQNTIINLTNASEDHTAMHWHGIRLPNDMDGVPYLTQLPIAQGETFAYEFTPPDAGTYWYHPHCLTMVQMAYGLTGALIVHEKDEPGFDDDHVLNLIDFLLDENDQLDTPYTLNNAARGGTLGNHMTANWLTAPEYECKAGGLARIRLINTDTTRIRQLFLSTSDLVIIAWDGQPVEESIPVPTIESPLILGPGQRADLIVLMPELEGESIDVLAALGASGSRVMASFISTGVSLSRSLNDVTPLPPNPLSQPDMQNAEILDFLFGWSPLGLVPPNNGVCGTLGNNFWSINRVAYPGDNAPTNEALAMLERGKTYIMKLTNGSPNIHPIHLHGLVFKPIFSNKRNIPANWTDTIVLQRDEVVDVVLVADNPGDWAFHCHVIEHQKTGLAGFISVV